MEWTEMATTYRLCDVFVDEDYRGRDPGKRLVGFIVEAPGLKGL